MKALLAALAIAAVALYATRLEYAPIYAAHDEILNAINGHAIATTGRDPNGRLLPLFTYIKADYWATPVVTYATALFLSVLPVSEATIRLPTVVVGLTSVLLMYLVARRLFASRPLALTAAVLLALTPAHFIHSRLAVDHLYPVPFVLGWLWCLTRFLEHRRPAALFAGMLLLGVGAYTYLASLVLMPLYALVTALVLVRAGEHAPRTWLVAAAGFLLPVSLLVPWYLSHPTHFTNQVNMYGVYDASRLSPLQGLRQLVSYTSLTSRVAVYYDGFNPSMLFFSGGSSVINATGRAGVFLFPLGVFLPLGLYRVLSRWRSPMGLVLLLGFLSAPVPAAVVNELMVNRMLVLVPFAVLIATCGVESLVQTGGRRRVLAFALLALVPVQFAFFYRDYMGDYRLRSAVWFERNIGGAVDALIEPRLQGPQPAVFLSTQEIPWIDYYWRFHLLKRNRADLLEAAEFFSPGELDVRDVPPGSLMLTAADSALKKRVEESGLYEQQALIAEPTGEPSFAVFARLASDGVHETTSLAAAQETRRK